MTLEQAAKEIHDALGQLLDAIVKTNKTTKDERDYAFAFNQASSAWNKYAALNAQAAEQVHSADPFDKSFAREYETALHIGSRRFGSECQHENVMHGKCTNCLRTVI